MSFTRQHFIDHTVSFCRVLKVLWFITFCGFGMIKSSELLQIIHHIWLYSSTSFDMKLYNPGNSEIERIDFICSSSLEQRKLLVTAECSNGCDLCWDGLTWPTIFCSILFFFIARAIAWAILFAMQRLAIVIICRLSVVVCLSVCDASVLWQNGWS